MRPPYLAGVEREHRHAPLEAYRVNVLPGDQHGRVDVGEALKFSAPVRRGDSRLPQERAVAAVDRHHLAIVEAAQHGVADDYRRGGPAQRQARHLLLLHPQLVPVRGAQAAQLAIPGAHRDQLLGDGDRGQHLAVDAHLPAGLAIGGTEREQPAIAGADDDQIRTGRGAAGKRCLGVRTPQQPPVLRVERHHVTLMAGSVDAAAVDGEPKPEAQRLGLLVIDRGAPQVLDAQCRCERGEFGRLVDGLVLGAGDHEDGAREEPGPALQLLHGAHLAAPAAVAGALPAAPALALTGASPASSAILMVRSAALSWWPPDCALRYSASAFTLSPLA